MSSPLGIAAAGGAAISAGSRLLGSHEGAHDFAFHLQGRDRIHIDALAAEEGAGVFDVVDARGFNVDGFEAGLGEFGAILRVLQAPAMQPTQSSMFGGSAPGLRRA